MSKAKNSLHPYFSMFFGSVFGFWSLRLYSWHTKQLTNLQLNLHFDTFFTKVQGVLKYDLHYIWRVQVKLPYHGSMGFTYLTGGSTRPISVHCFRLLACSNKL